MESEINVYAVELGMMIKTARERSQISIRNLASFANARRSFVIKLENGTLPNYYRDVMLRVVGSLDFNLKEREKVFVLINLYCPPGINEKTKSRRKKTFPWKRRGTPVTVWQRSQMSLRLFAYR